MRSLAALLAVPVCVVLFAAPLRAQVPHLEVGTRVRVSASAIAPERLTGSVASADTAVLNLATAESAAVRPGAADSGFAIPVEAIERLEVSLGEKANTWKGLGWGALSGAVLGAGLVGIVCWADGGCSSSEVSTGVWVGYFALLGAGAGGVLGLIIGSVVKTEHWSRVYEAPIP